METERRARLESLFDRALDVPESERAAFLDRHCASDPDLRAELAALLAADLRAETGELDRWFGAATAAPLAEGTVVAGRYRIVGQIGAGGMGIVYAAEQLKPARRVALKAMRPGSFGSDALRRFTREAEALGRLQHPGIAQVLEAGVDGRDPPFPFLVMEFVAGTDLFDHARDLPVRARIELFADVCEAVAHAHARGVVHRDLKPSNVMVTRDGDRPRVKVLDFGVARFVAGDAPAHTLLTRTHQIVGTLGYMSPEQVSGGAVDARSDVYGLGATLFELLTGRLPVDVHGRSLADAARRVTEVEPKTLGDVDPALRGDLSTIVQKCLEKDPARRYADAGELAADLRRLLGDEPIRARPPSALYQLGKFARRHRAIVAGVVATLLALVAGLIVALRYARAADHQRAAAERLAGDLRALMHDVLFDVEDSLADVPGATRAREQLVQVGLRYAERLAREVGSDPRLAHELGAAYHKLGKIQGGSGVANLGNRKGALESFARAEALLRESLAREPHNPGAHLELVVVLQSIAGVQRDLGASEARLAALAALRAAAGRMVELGIDAAVAADAAARAAAEEGRVLLDLGRLEAALAAFEQYRAHVAERFRARGDPVDRDNLGVILGYVADLEARLDRPETAEARHLEALELAEAAYAEAPESRDAIAQLAERHRRLGHFHSDRDAYAQALEHYRRALELNESIVALDPADVHALRRLGISHEGVARTLLELGEPAVALAEYEQFARICTGLCERNPEHAGWRRDLMIAHAGLGSAAAQLGDAERAEAELGRARVSAEAARDASPMRAEAWSDVANMWHETAVVRTQLGLDGGSRELLEGAIEARERQRAALEHLQAEGLLDAAQTRVLESLPTVLEGLRAELAELRGG